MSYQGSIIADFGSGSDSLSVFVSDVVITTSRLVDAWVMPTATATNTADDTWVEDFSVCAGNISDGVGFTVYIKCNNGLAHGQHKIAYVYN